MRAKRLCPSRVQADMPHGLSPRAAHIVAIHRALCASKGKPLEVVNVSQSVHRAGVATKLVMPCITPNGAFWVERASRLLSPVEKCLFQGLPMHQLDIGGLSSCQIESLAGNGMHSWAAASDLACGLRLERLVIMVLFTLSLQVAPRALQGHGGCLDPGSVCS